MELELKILHLNDLPFLPITTELGVIVRDKNGNETTLDKILIKDTDGSLLINNGKLEHTNIVTPINELSFMKIKHDKHGHITENLKILLSDDFEETVDHTININYNII